MHSRLNAYFVYIGHVIDTTSMDIMHECAESQQQQQEAICVAILGTLHTKISRIFCLPLDVNRNSSRFLSSTLYTHPLYMSPMV